MKTYAKSILSKAFKHGEGYDHMAALIGEEYTKNDKERHVVYNSVHSEEFILLEKITKAVTKKFVEEDNCGDKNAFILVFCYKGVVFYTNYHMSFVGRDDYTEIFTETKLGVVYSTKECEKVSDLDGNLSIALNKEELHSFLELV